MMKREFYENWLATFASTVSKRDIERYVKETGNYIWHVFSFGLLDAHRYLVGEEAKNAYDKMNKSGALCMQWDEQDVTHELTGEQHAAKALDDCTEVYVVGKDFSWTYIKTHESMCGPYFMKRP